MISLRFVYILVMLQVSVCITPSNCQISSDLTNQFDQFFREVVQNGLVDYEKVQEYKDLAEIRTAISNVEVESLTARELKAMLINVYNFSVIEAIASEYPVPSVREIPMFFSKKRITWNNKKLSLDELEKEVLFKAFPDKRLHFALNCGAVDCPPLRSRAFRPENLNEQLESHTLLVINDRKFIRVNAIDRSILISEIFKWYSGDFGSLSEIREFLKQYRKPALPEYEMGFYPNDWSVNDVAKSKINSQHDPNQSRYIVSATIPRGSYEIKWFNNLYSEVSGNENELTSRSSYFTSQLSVVYGLQPRLSIGFDVRYRRVANGLPEHSFLDVLSFSDAESMHEAFSSFGPKVRWAPVDRWSNFSIQSAYWFQLDDQLEGNTNQPFLDWNGDIWFTQIFNDFDIGTQYSLFAELDILGEDLGFQEDDLNYWTTPMTAIFSYFPSNKWSLYALANLAPRWLPSLDVYAQAGLGVKHQFTPSFEVELLYTAFTNAGLIDRHGRAATYNIGVRYSR